MSIEYTDYFGENQLSHVDTVEVAETEKIVSTMMGEICNTNKVYMRIAPDKDSKHIDILEKGEEVMIDGVAEDVLGNGWYHLITASGKEGYTMAEYVKIVE